ncbi:tryptophan aminotransferase of Arabidopsis 1, SHADE AVOIDANCE 3, WEAK ETHYLENE INSENSITIVE 8 [Hibiscus trionum]|uniref:Tryptophan aminotransferase of Arabidopsis 1, SHADE AVOIDANCE 3, WEAK ETHYLENE INSENSITIVE 8 n=1 Tax=Hibiscus trionum TaxID=183268 RepID=A0A9W7IXC2_HIBTR|nr:tryptophan aminotransferase of Arabidopsis 1, SHADE AVOIDANCE 3, WEAK ETHYLENE INSENSITIVE 8 [Hibiscus trionum]
MEARVAMAVPTEKSEVLAATKTPTTLSSDSIINVARGDPALYEPYWKKQGDRCKLVTLGDELMSYFSNAVNLCWFLMPELDRAIRELHHVVGNAEVDDRFIIVGNGSTQVFHALLYALSSSGEHVPVNVVAAAPFYSSYPEETEFLQSGLYKWAGDANCFDKDGAYIEVVTSPNNPDGSIRGTVVNREGGKSIHDLAYYWPQYTPITHKANHDVMLFTFSKATGHAGSRIGWAIVLDKTIASKMVKFVEVSSIGVSKESQLRAATILGVISNDCQNPELEEENFFKYGRHLMSDRWEKLREAVMKCNGALSLPEYPQGYCRFTGKYTDSYPAFAWLKCKEGLKCEELLKDKCKIMTRGGTSFGVEETYTRVSMLSSDAEFNLMLERLSAIKGTIHGN